MIDSSLVFGRHVVVDIFLHDLILVWTLFLQVEESVLSVSSLRGEVFGVKVNSLDDVVLLEIWSSRLGMFYVNLELCELLELIEGLRKFPHRLSSLLVDYRSEHAIQDESSDY